MLDRLRELVVINHAIVSTLDYDEVLRLVVEKTSAFTSADSCVLLLKDPDGMARVVQSVGVDPELARRFAAPLDERINVALRDLLAYEQGDTFIGVPVLERGSIQGILAVYRQGRHEPDPDEEFLLSALADQASIALEHAWQYRVVQQTSAEKSRLLAAIQANTATALAYLDRELTFQEANEAFARFAGLPRGAIVNKRHSEIFAEAGPNAQVAEVLRTGEPAELHELPATGRTDEHWDWYARAIRGEQGAVEGLVISAIEVTEKVRAREALEQEARRKDDFMAMLSHELRNPLMPIRTGLYLLDRAPAGGEQARQAREIMDRQVTHMARLIDDLLDVTRIARGKIQLHWERVELRAVVRGTVEDHRPSFNRRRVALEVTLPDQPIWLQGDPTRIAQVVGNLLNNALKFTPPGGRTWVEVARPVERPEAIIRIGDTGTGIDSDMLPRLFDPFSQVAATLDRSQGGLGLGLALVRGLVDLHGGKVEAQSEGPGHGSEFTVHLPLAADGSDPALEDTPEGAPPRAHRILLIEDNLDAALSLQMLLELDGHEVTLAHSGPDGLTAARRDRPEVIFCDIGLPGMDGYEVARKIREAPELSSTLLVALSGYARPEDTHAASAAGFDRHLAKPPRLEQIRQLLAKPPG